MSRSSRRKQRPSMRLITLRGENLVETDTARVIRLGQPAEGPDARNVTVMLEPDVSAAGAADELRLVANELERLQGLT